MVSCWLLTLSVFITVGASWAHILPQNSPVSDKTKTHLLNDGHPGDLYADGKLPLPYWAQTFQPVNNVQVTLPPCVCDGSSVDGSNSDRLVNLTETLITLLEGQGQTRTPAPTPIVLFDQPRDCYEILQNGVNVSGRYAIYPNGSGDPFFVYCDMETDGGGWTVFQRRESGDVDFYRDWSEYKHGFGSVSAEHWLGNDKIHRLSSQKSYHLRVDLEDFEGETRHAIYSIFSLGDETGNFTLTATNYSGDAGNSLGPHSGAEFSTRDRDNDNQLFERCSEVYRGAWWYTVCHYSNLNGLYLRGSTSEFAKGVVWKHWLGYNYSLKKTEMKIRPV